MSTIITYKRLQVVDPTPTGDGGEALNSDFELIDDLVIFNQGGWSTVPTYLPNDLVSWSGVYYLCLNTNAADIPPSANWVAISGPTPLLQLTAQSTPPAAAAGGIYFSGTHFYVCKDGSTWTLLS